MPSWGNYYWPFFLILVSALFLVPEIIGLVGNSANTLSDYCWRELNVNLAFNAGRHSVAWWISQFAFYVAVVLLAIHIWYRGV